MPGMTDAPSGRNILLLGGSSAIGLAIVEHLLAEQQGSVVVAVRDPARGEGSAARLRQAGASSTAVIRFDGGDAHAAAGAIDEAFAILGRVDVTVVAFGAFADQDDLGDDLDAALRLIEINTMGGLAVGEALASHLRAQGSGTIIAISSAVARAANGYLRIYAASKAGFDTYYCSLGRSLAGDGVRMLVVRPPGVNTSLVSNNEAYHSPDEVAVEVMSALASGVTEFRIPPKGEKRASLRSSVRAFAGRVRRRLRSH